MLKLPLTAKLPAGLIGIPHGQLNVRLKAVTA